MARRQQEIAGTERKHDAEISAAADDLYTVRTKRMKLTKKEVEAADRLIEIMQNKNVTDYVDEDLQIRVALKDATTKVSVKKLEERVAPVE